MKSLTLPQVKAKLRGISKEKKPSIVCALIGHSRIVSECFGYIHCGRCDAQIADKLGGAGYSQAPECVQIGHNCARCRSNFKKMDWKDKFMVPNPFKKLRVA